MLQTKVFRQELGAILTRSISYLSNDFNKIMVEPDPSFLEKSLNLRLDIFIERDNRQLDLLEQLQTLRKQKESSKVELFPSVIVKQLLDTSSQQDVLHVIEDRRQYGIFIDNFTGCYLLNHFLSTSQFKEATKVALEIVKQQNYENILLKSLSLISCYKYLQQRKANLSEKLNEPVEEPSSEVKKIRVKFLRNLPELDHKELTHQYIFGQALLQLSNIKEETLSINFKIIGNVLCSNLEEITNLLNATKLISKEVLALCCGLLEIIDSDNKDAIKNALDSRFEICQSGESFEDRLTAHIKECVQHEETKLIAEHKQNFGKWLKNFENVVKEHLQQKDQEKRIKDIGTILDYLQVKKESLWFFEKKDDIDIKIFKKKVYYPKKWFGKKKKPRVVDSFYVPPEITRKQL